MTTLFNGTPLKATTHVNQNEGLMFEKSSPGKKAYRLAELDVPAVDAAALLGTSERTRGAWDASAMPELSEIEIVRHFTRLSTWNYAIDLGMYPLGSCTMKYNPRINEAVARLEGIAEAHPYQPESLAQGCLGIGTMSWKAVDQGDHLEVLGILGHDWIVGPVIPYASPRALDSGPTRRSKRSGTLKLAAYHRRAAPDLPQRARRQPAVRIVQKDMGDPSPIARRRVGNVAGGQARNVMIAVQVHYQRLDRRGRSGQPVSGDAIAGQQRGMLGAGAVENDVGGGDSRRGIGRQSGNRIVARQKGALARFIHRGQGLKVFWHQRLFQQEQIGDGRGGLRPHDLGLRGQDSAVLLQACQHAVVLLADIEQPRPGSN